MRGAFFRRILDDPQQIIRLVRGRFEAVAQARRDSAETPCLQTSTNREVDMLRILSVGALALGLVACGGVSEEAKELQAYAKVMEGMDSLNRQVQEAAIHMDEPSIEVTRSDLEAGRQLVASYLAALKEVEQPTYSSLRRAYDNYVTKVEQAIGLAADSGRELKQERGNIAIALRHIEKMTRRHYKSAVDLLWLRQKIEVEMPLKWPEE